MYSNHIEARQSLLTIRLRSCAVKSINAKDNFFVSLTFKFIPFEHFLVSVVLIHEGIIVVLLSFVSKALHLPLF